MKNISILILTILLTGCSTIPDSEKLTAVPITKISGSNVKTLTLNSPVEYFYTEKVGGAVLKYNSNNKRTLQAGEYVAVAIGNGGTYYQYKGETSRFLKTPIGGIKIPNNENEGWRAWSGYKTTTYEPNRIITNENENLAIEYPVFKTKPDYVIKNP